MIKYENINLLHGSMLHGGGYSAVNLGRKFDLPVLAHAHGADVQVVEEIGYGAILKDFDKINTVINEANRLVAVSSINAENLIKLGASPDKVSVIHNGIHIDEINKIPFENQRMKMCVNEDDFLLISVGRNKPVKRIELLFKALDKLKGYKQIKCICVGPIENLNRLVKKYNLSDKVVLTNQIPQKISLGENPPYPDLINTYRSCDLYISTSYVESFGIAALEALTCGIPIIVGKKHGILDIVEKGETGWNMEKETSEELAEIILNCYRNRENIKGDSEKIKKSVLNLGWSNIVQQYVKLYNTIL